MCSALYFLEIIIKLSLSKFIFIHWFLFQFLIFLKHPNEFSELIYKSRSSMLDDIVRRH